VDGLENGMSFRNRRGTLRLRGASAALLVVTSPGRDASLSRRDLQEPRRHSKCREIDRNAPFRVGTRLFRYDARLFRGTASLFLV
jgi:hypothetical protein